MIDIGIVILSSGRVPYLKATIKSLVNSKINLRFHAVHVVVNGVHANLESIQLMYPDFTMHHISNNSQTGLLEYAFKLGIQHEFCFFLEEDWLVNKQLNDNDLYFLATLPQARQAVFSRFRKGHELEESNEHGVARTMEIAGLEKKFLIQDTFFSLNPTLIKKEVLQDIIENFNWLQPNNFTVNLEKNLAKFLGSRFGNSILVTNESKFYVVHLGLLTATKNFNLVNSNHARFAENAMRLHVLLVKIKHSNEFFKRIYIPRKMRRFVEMR